MPGGTLTISTHNEHVYNYEELTLDLDQNYMENGMTTTHQNDRYANNSVYPLTWNGNKCDKNIKYAVVSK